MQQRHSESKIHLVADDLLLKDIAVHSVAMPGGRVRAAFSENLWVRNQQGDMIPLGIARRRRSE
jgi:hypothetical protein